MKNKFNFLEFFQSLKSTLLVTILLFTCVSVWGTDEYVETALSDISADDIVLIVRTDATTKYAMSNANGTSSAPSAVSVTITNGKITDPADYLKWNISNDKGTFTVYVNGSTSSWLYCTSSNNGVRVGDNTNKTFTLDGGYLKHGGTSRYVGVYNNADWRCYTSKGGNIEKQTFAFYVKKGNTCTAPTEPTNGTITKNSASVSWTSDGEFWDVYCSDVNTAPTTQTTATGLTSKSYTFTGLTPSTTYYWWVRTSCSETSKSSWKAGSSFTTSSITYTDYITQCATTYDVKFYVDGAEETSLAQKVVDGETPTSVTAPTKDGFTFDGWYNNSDYTGDKIDPTTVTITANKNFYGRFNAILYNVTLDKGDYATTDGSFDIYFNATAKNSMTAVSGVTENYEINGYYTAKAEGVKVLNADGTLIQSVTGWTSADGRWINCSNEQKLYAQYTNTAREMTSVVVSGAPNKTSYYNGDTFDPTGLVVTANYNVAPLSEVVTSQAVFSTPDPLTTDQTSVSITATYNEMTSEEYVVNGLSVTDMPKYTVTFDKGTGVCSTASLTQESYGASITLPTASTTDDDWSFYGWSATNISTAQSTAPDPIYAGGSAYTPTSDITLYAVYKKGAPTSWKKVALTDLSEAGIYAIISSDGHAFNGTMSSGKGNQTTDAFVFDSKNVATSVPEGVCELTFTVSSSHYTLYNANKGYLYATSNTSGNLAWSQTVPSSYWMVYTKNSVSNWEYVCGTSSFAYLLVYNSQFNTYSSNQSGSTKPLFAKKTIGTLSYATSPTMLITPTVTFETKDVPANFYTAGGTEAAGTLVAADTYARTATASNEGAITYESSAPTIASVNASTGEVTAVAAGAVTIKAKVAAVPDVSKAAEASYEITVTTRPVVGAITISPNGGQVEKGATVSLSCATDGAAILYSTDGTVPSISYSEPIAINAECTLKAKATKDTYVPAVAQASFTVNLPEQVVVWSADGPFSFRKNSDEQKAFTAPTASITTGDGSLSYAGDNDAIATVNTSTGAVTFVGGLGTVTITATASATENYKQKQITYTITVLKEGITRTGDFQLVTNVSQLNDGDYILLTSKQFGSDTKTVNAFKGNATSFQSLTVTNDEISKDALGDAKILTVGKETIDDVVYYTFNYGETSDIYLAAGSTSSADAVTNCTTIVDNARWTLDIKSWGTVKTGVKGRSTYGVLSFNGNNLKTYESKIQKDSLYIYKQADKKLTPQEISFTTSSYTLIKNEAEYNNWTHQVVSGNQTPVTYSSNNAAVADVESNVVVLKGGVGTATITALAAESAVYKKASATYTITVTAALKTITFNVNGTATPIKEEASNGGITLPANPAAVGEYIFLGWGTEAIAEDTKTRPTFKTFTLNDQSKYVPAAEGETYYAIYAREENGDGSFYLQDGDNYAGAFSSTAYTFSNASTKAAATIFNLEDNYLFYMNNNVKTYISSTSTSSTASEYRKLSTSTTKSDASTWTVKEYNGMIELYSSVSKKNFVNNNNSIWGAYPYTMNNSEYRFTKLLVADQYFTTAPNTLVSPVLTWAQGGNDKALETDATLDNAASATVSGQPVSISSYSSSNENIATVSNVGVVTAKAGGEAIIYANVAANPGVSRALTASYKVTVTKKVATLEFKDGINTGVYVGEAYKVNVKELMNITTNGEVTFWLDNQYSSKTTSYATITDEGIITGVSPVLNQTIYVKAAETAQYQEKTTSKSFQIKALAKQNDMKFATPTAYVYDLNEVVEPFTKAVTGANTTVTYASDNTAIATVNETSGLVTVSTTTSGTATITATAAEGKVGDVIYEQTQKTYTITIQYQKPTITPTADGWQKSTNKFRADQTVTIEGKSGDKLYYTLDGSEPTTSSTLYSEPFSITETTAVKAIAVSNDGSMTSPVETLVMTKAIPELTLTYGGEVYADGSEISMKAGEQLTLTAQACKIAYTLENVKTGASTSKPSSDATTVIDMTKTGTYLLEATPRWNVTGGYEGETQLFSIEVKGGTYLPFSHTGNGTALAAYDFVTVSGTALDNYDDDSNVKTPIKMKACSIVIQMLDKPTTMTYYVRLNGSSGADNLFVVEESADGVNYNALRTLTSNIPTKANGEQYTETLDPSTRFVRWSFNKASGNIGLGNIVINTKDKSITTEEYDDEEYTGSIIVRGGGVYTFINEEARDLGGDLTIEESGKVDVSVVQAPVTVNNLYLKSTLGDNDNSASSAQFNGVTAANFFVNGSVFIDIKLDPSGIASAGWYAFAVPFEVALKDGVYGKLQGKDWAALTNEKDFAVMQYQGDVRAQGAYGWIKVHKTGATTLKPGVFYLVTVADTDFGTLRFKKTDGSDINNGKSSISLSEFAKSGEGKTTDAGWNGIANPNLTYSDVKQLGGDKAQVYYHSTNSFDALDLDNTSFVVGSPFFVQANGASDYVELTAATHDALRAPMRETTSGEFNLRLGKNTSSYVDQLYLSATDDATSDYQIGHDMVKSYMGEPKVAQMYINGYGQKLCDAEFQLNSNDEAEFPLTITAPQAGDYQLYLNREMTNATLYLYENGSLIWNLSQGAYPVSLEKGTNDDYTLVIKKLPNTPTDINTVRTSEDGVQKFILDERLIIIRNGRIYNAAGALVK